MGLGIGGTKLDSLTTHYAKVSELEVSSYPVLLTASDC